MFPVKRVGNRFFFLSSLAEVFILQREGFSNVTTSCQEGGISFFSLFADRSFQSIARRVHECEYILSRGWNFVFFRSSSAEVFILEHEGFSNVTATSKIVEHGDCKHLKNDDIHWFDCSLRCEKILPFRSNDVFIFLANLLISTLASSAKKSLFRASWNWPNGPQKKKT